MAGNRFKNSVDAAVTNTSGVIPDNIQDNIPDNIPNNISYNTKNNMPDNIRYNILKSVSEKERKDRGGNHTFYLSSQVSDALGKLAKKTGKSKSTLVNDILKAVFESEEESDQ